MKFLLLLLLITTNLMAQNYKVSDHYNGSTFFNPENHHMHSIFQLLKWKFTADQAVWPEKIENKKYDLPRLSTEKALVTFINHASFYIQMNGLNIITDPVYSERVSPVKFAGPKRVREPGIDIDSLGKVDIVIISHNHYDHLDADTLKKLNNKYRPLFLVPLGDYRIMHILGIKNVKEMDWWETHEQNGVKIHFTPSQHWSARGLMDKCDSLWGSYFIESSEAKVYFAGDTGYGSHFKKIHEKLGAPDLSLLPIGAYAPRWFMKYHHMNPEDAVLAHKDLNAKMSLGMHFGVFQLTDEPIDEPVEKLKSFNIENFKVIDLGETYQIN